LFVNNNPLYSEFVQNILAALEKNAESGNYKIKYELLRKTEHFTQIFLSHFNFDLTLKLDFINDVAPHYGDFENHPVLGKIDSWRNILSNKISALFRYEAKDYVDLWIIAKNNFFDWIEILAEAKTKEAGVDPVVIYELLKSFPGDALATIKWAVQVNEDVFLPELFTIADDIFLGKKNSLFKMGCEKNK